MLKLIDNVLSINKSKIKFVYKQPNIDSFVFVTESGEKYSVSDRELSDEARQLIENGELFDMGAVNNYNKLFVNISVIEAISKITVGYKPNEAYRILFKDGSRDSMFAEYDDENERDDTFKKLN